MTSQRETDREARQHDLEQRIAHHRARYYAGSPEISDAAFDALEDELRKLDPESPILGKVGSPIVVTEWEKARHEIPMGSLNKAVNEDELRAWLTRCEEIATDQKLGPLSDLFVAEKLDGISIEVIYRHGRFADAITRGDGLEGERISANVARMKGVPRAIARTDAISVRGEIVLRLSDRARHFPEMTSARNAAAGLSKRLDGSGAEHLSVLFYDLADDVGVATETEKFALLEQLGFATPQTSRGRIDDVLETYRRYGEELRSGLDYDIDGLVIYVDDRRAQSLLGELNQRPRGAIALKFASPAKVSRVKQITWDTGPSGRVTPVAIVDPVELAGATVQRASLHNAANVRRLGLGVGDEVLVSRRNDVIPYVEEVITKRGPSAEAPQHCPVCSSSLASEGEYLLCRNTLCPAIVKGRIRNWIDATGALEWGDVLITQLVDAKLVHEPGDLYRLTVGDIAGIERRGEKSATKCLAELTSKLPLSLPTFLTALGIEGFSTQTARLVVGNGFDTLDKLFGASDADLVPISGLGPIKAAAIVRGLAQRKDEVARLVEAGIVPTSHAEAGVLAGKVFAFTGKSELPRASLTSLVERHGGQVVNTVNKKTNYLVIADVNSNSTKAVNARNLGTELITEQDLLSMVENEGA
jgi:DNA ligase (NAD+)